MRLPATLKILDGKRWRGKLRVEGRVDGRYQVQFDAENPRGGHERYIYDRAVLSSEQIRGWTGVTLPEE